jgi:hypothetical protein
MKLRTLFSDSRIVAAYSSSNDASLSILQAHGIEVIIVPPYRQKTQFTFSPTIVAKPTIANRTARIADARNCLLQHIRQSYSDFEFFAMIDANNYSCVGEVNLDSVSSALQRDDWDSVSFHREAGYYDIWALSYSPYNYSFMHFTDTQRVVSDMRKHFSHLLMDYITNRPTELIPVYSSFNGFAIYRTPKFLNCSYSDVIQTGLIPDFQEQVRMYGRPIQILTGDCEHRKFHFEAIQKNSARIRICTQPVFQKLDNPPEGLQGPA